MEGGIFLLLAVLALFIGTRAKRSRQVILSKKAIRQRERSVRFIMILALIVVSIFLLVYIPFLYQDLNIALHTHFTLENYLSIAILLVGILTVFSLLKRLKIIKPNIAQST